MWDKMSERYDKVLQKVLILFLKQLTKHLKDISLMLWRKKLSGLMLYFLREKPKRLLITIRTEVSQMNEQN